MALVVVKYGGSSLATPEKLKALAQRVAERRRGGDDLVVVVSAMGGMTDALIGQAGQITTSPSRREMDMLLSAGERIAMALMTMALHECGVSAISFTGSQSGIITNCEHSGARIREVRPHRIRQALEQGDVVVVAGYQGVSSACEVTTLGRGGSDTSAVALAAYLQADYCEIMSDVAGVFRCDPNLVAEAACLLSLDYRGMQLMARLGAKVLHERAVEVAETHHVRLFAGKSDAPEEGGTWIEGDVEHCDTKPWALVGAEHAGYLRMPPSVGEGLKRDLASCAYVLHEAVRDGYMDLFYRYQPEDRGRVNRAIAEIGEAGGKGREEKLSLISVLGGGRQTNLVLGLCDILESAKMSGVVSARAEGFSLVAVNSRHYADALRHLYKHFFL